MSFPLSRRPGVVVIADDSQTFADTMRLVVSTRWPVRTIYSSSELETYFGAAATAFEVEGERQHQILARAVQGGSLVEDILAYWRICLDRYEIPMACMFDYFMPGKNGLDAMRAARDWPGAKVLVSGMAEEAVSIQAFNAGEIHGYLPKQIEGLTHSLLSTLDRLIEQQVDASKLGWPLAETTLSLAQLMALRKPAVQKLLREWTDAYFVEYVVLGQPFGILGLSAEGESRWLQMHLWNDLEEIANVALREGTDAHEGDETTKGALVWIDKAVVPLMSAPRASVATEMAIRGELLASAVRLDERLGPGQQGSYAAFRKKLRRTASPG